MKRVGYILLLIIWCSLSRTSLAQLNPIDKVLVVINNDPITLSEYKMRYRIQELENNGSIHGTRARNITSVNQELLDLLVNERLQSIHAIGLGIQITDQDIQSEIQKIITKNHLYLPQFETMLIHGGINPEIFYNHIKNQHLIRRLVDVAVNANIKVSEQEIDHYLNIHKELIISNESFEISHLFVSKSAGKDEKKLNLKSEKDLNVIRLNIIQGQSFEESVYKYSNKHKKNGGYIGWKTENQLPAIFINALNKTKIGEISELVQSKNGFHILKLHAKRLGGDFIKQQKVKHILIQPNRKNLTHTEALQYAFDILDEFKKGASFDSLARIHSDDVYSREKGGLIGWVSSTQLGSDIQQVTNHLNIGEISQPIESMFGFHIVQVLGRREYDINKDKIRHSVRQVISKRKFAILYRDWLSELKHSAHIEYVFETV